MEKENFGLIYNFLLQNSNKIKEMDVEYKFLMWSLLTGSYDKLYLRNRIPFSTNVDGVAMLSNEVFKSFVEYFCTKNLREYLSMKVPPDSLLVKGGAKKFDFFLTYLERKSTLEELQEDEYDKFDMEELFFKNTPLIEMLMLNMIPKGGRAIRNRICFHAFLFLNKFVCVIDAYENEKIKQNVLTFFRALEVLHIGTNVIIEYVPPISPSFYMSQIAFFLSDYKGNKPEESAETYELYDKKLHYLGVNGFWKAYSNTIINIGNQDKRSILTKEGSEKNFYFYPNETVPIQMDIELPSITSQLTVQPRISIIPQSQTQNNDDISVIQSQNDYSIQTQSQNILNDDLTQSQTQNSSLIQTQEASFTELYDSDNSKMSNANYSKNTWNPVDIKKRDVSVSTDKKDNIEKIFYIHTNGNTKYFASIDKFNNLLQKQSMLSLESVSFDKLFQKVIGDKHIPMSFDKAYTIAIDISKIAQPIYVNIDVLRSQGISLEKDVNFLKVCGNNGRDDATCEMFLNANISVDVGSMLINTQPHTVNFKYNESTYIDEYISKNATSDDKSFPLLITREILPKMTEPKVNLFDGIKKLWNDVEKRLKSPDSNTSKSGKFLFWYTLEVAQCFNQMGYTQFSLLHYYFITKILDIYSIVKVIKPKSVFVEPYAIPDKTYLHLLFNECNKDIEKDRNNFCRFALCYCLKRLELMSLHTSNKQSQLEQLKYSLLSLPMIPINGLVEQSNKILFDLKSYGKAKIGRIDVIAMDKQNQGKNSIELRVYENKHLNWIATIHDKTKIPIILFTVLKESMKIVKLAFAFYSGYYLGQKL